MTEDSLESDWQIYKKRVPEWRERYLAQKNEEIVAALSNIDKTPTEQFWDAKHVIEGEAKILTDCLDPHSRSNMFLSLLLMIRYELIEESDLNEFSEELREQILSTRN